MCIFFTDYTKTNAFFLGTSTDVTSQMTALHEQTDWPCATSTAEDRELQNSETQPSETLSDVARKQSKYSCYIEAIAHKNGQLEEERVNLKLVGITGNGTILILCCCAPPRSTSVHKAWLVKKE